ncbi:hypothetical protein BCR35DRAFT_335542 [Leucosporidium creatinivorum]|uniref:SWIM-type domain-containing protein n=1 Tax=Leucosporidium creatinivorum TaxID=106004 RepID=A0A1Y2D8Y5_9BASI|nr:hypothetical protein BCR35DRAFT_335542 [Leucosporidium creatinivorum]
MSIDLTNLLQAQLCSLSNPLSETDLRSLALLTSSSLLIDALDLIDKGQVSQITLPNGQHLYQVAGTSGAYSVHPNLPQSPRSLSDSFDQPHHQQLGYCPCPAFSYSVFKADHQVICKHLLAVKLAQHLGAPPLVKKEMGLRWLAAFATGFAVPVQQGGAAGMGGGGGA